MSSSRSVTAATAGASVQQSSEGARWPLMSLRLSSAMSDRSKPAASLSTARALTYDQSAAIPSSSTLRSQPPKMGIQ